jgi:hypothetical protein
MATKDGKGKPVEEESSVKWGTVGYLRQLSTVVIGILITFGGSELIQKRAERKRNYFVLATVRDDLQSNLARLDTLRGRLTYEHEGAIVLRRVYELMTKFNERPEMHNSPKVRFQDDRNAMPYRAPEATFQSRGRAFVEMVKFPTIRNFIVSTAGNNPIFASMMAEADNLAVKIPRVIDEIEREVGR